MFLRLRNFSCKVFFVNTILLNFFFQQSIAEVDERSNKSLETRLHSIYQQHYSKPVLDAEWFKIVEAIDEQSYNVKVGDTLWGISKVYFGDGNYWSKLWSVNKSITNPHMIFAGDKVVFTTGTFGAPPSIAVEKDAAPPVGEEGSMTMAEGESGESAVAPTLTLKESDSAPPAPLPNFFTPPKQLTRRGAQLTDIVPRPERVNRTSFTLQTEVLSQEPNVLGRVESIGKQRVITAEAGIVIIRADSGKLPAIGDQLSILDSSIEEDLNGHVIKVLALVKVVRSLDNNMFECRVVEQFDGILNRSLASTYIPPVVDMKFEGEAKQVALKVLNIRRKSVWSTGDVIYVKSDEALNMGDLLSMTNKYDDDIDTFLSEGAVKVVSVSDSYATGVVLYTRNVINSESSSAPVKTKTGLFGL